MDSPATRRLAFAIGILWILVTTRFSSCPYGIIPQNSPHPWRTPVGGLD